MNRYPAWLNWLVLVILLLGIVLALPNIYGSVPAVQIASTDGKPYGQAKIDQIVGILEIDDLQPEAAYLQDGRVVLRFDSVEDQLNSSDRLRDRIGQNSSVALTLTPKLPDWIRNLGLSPISLGLDLRGGIYVLLEVDMDAAVESRLNHYEQDFSERLQEAGIRRQVRLDDQIIKVRVARDEDFDKAQDIVRNADRDLLILDGGDDKSFRVRMSEQQIKARQDFAIEQNITTLRNRVDELGVSEPLVQRQGVDRIVVQLPGVQDPNRLDDILTATATLEFRLVDGTGDSLGSRRYPGRGEMVSQILRRQIVASGDQIIDATSGLAKGSLLYTLPWIQPAVRACSKPPSKISTNQCLPYLSRPSAKLLYDTAFQKRVMFAQKKLSTRQPFAVHSRTDFRLPDSHRLKRVILHCYCVPALLQHRSIKWKRERLDQV